MSDSHYIWREILACKDQECLPNWVWSKLKAIAGRMETTDFFAGSKTELGEKFLHALGYETWQTLRKSHEQKEHLDFLEAVIRIAMKKHKGKLNNLYYHGDPIHWKDKQLDGEALKQHVERARKALGIAPLTHTDNSRIELTMMGILENYDEEYGEMPPLIDRYQSKQAEILVRKRLLEKALKRKEGDSKV